MDLIFEDLEIWQMSRKFCQDIYAVSSTIKDSKLKEQELLENQMVLDQEKC